MHLPRTLLLLLTLGLLGACTTKVEGSGAGTGPAPGPSGGGAPGGSATSPAAASAPLTGHVSYSTADGSVVIDLATLQSEETSLDDLWPTADGSRWIGYDTARRYSDEEDDVVVYDRTWKRLQTLPIRKSLHGTARFSPDQKHIAVFWADESAGESYTRSTLTVFDLEMNPVYRLPKATAFDWMPDGRLVYGEESGIFLADEVGKSGKPILPLDEAPYDVSVSRDGARLALVLGAKLDEAHVWTASIDGTALTQLTQSGHNELNPTWTADGRLLVRHYVSASLEGYNGCPDLYMIASRSPAPFDPSKSPDLARKISYIEPRSTSPRSACPFSRVAWIP